LSTVDNGSMSLARQYVTAFVRVLCSLDDVERGRCLSHESKSVSLGLATFSVLTFLRFFLLA